MQVSLTVKSVIAQLLNCVVLPLVAAYYIKRNIYGSKGLAEDVLYFSVSNALLSPLLRILDPSYYYYRARKWWVSRPCNYKLI